ncbi:MAG: 3-dehydroquinate synthase, partial [Psychromonas sp.]|nr:3-dehydroquinate synthase [Psychromonas sp.]
KTALELELIDRPQLDKIISLIKQFDLPLSSPENMTYASYAEHMQLDKKVLNGKLRLVLPTSIGSSELFDNVSEAVLRRVIEQ